MDFSLTEEQTQIRDLTRQILSDNCGDDFLMTYSKSLADPASDRYSPKLWSLLAESGLLGTAVPENCGGSGFGIVELCQILEEQGQHVAPIPLLPTLVYGGLTLSKYGNDEQQQKYLSGLVSGETILTAAIAEESMALAIQGQCKATEASGQWKLNGERIAVPYAQQASAILVAADTDNGKAVFLVDRSSQGLSSEFADSGNFEPFYNLTFDNVVAEPVGSVSEGEQVLQYLLNCGAVASCATMLGVTEQSMRRTAEYTSERKQFETTIASFQNTSMKVADCYIDIEALRSTYYEALWKLSEGKLCDAEIKVAKYWACGAGHRVTHICQHLHGGIGADVEFPLHRYYLWFKQMDLTLGGGTKQAADLGALMAKDDSINLLSNLI